MKDLSRMDDSFPITEVREMKLRYLVIDQKLRADGEIAHIRIEHRHRRRRRFDEVPERPRSQI